MGIPCQEQGKLDMFLQTVFKENNMTTILEAVETFTKKYDFKDIWSVGVDETSGIIHVYTSNAKIWVDLPNTHEGYTVKMNVSRKPRPATTPVAPATATK
jgi:hypothetical protein